MNVEDASLDFKLSQKQMLDRLAISNGLLDWLLPVRAFNLGIWNSTKFGFYLHRISMIEVPALGYLNFKSKLWNRNCKVWNQTVFTKPVTLFTKQIPNIYMNPLEYKVIKKSVFAFLNAMV